MSNDASEVPAVPDVSYFSHERQRGEVRARAERNRARVVTARAAGMQPVAVDLEAVANLERALRDAHAAIYRGIAPLSLAGLGECALYRELDELARRLDQISRLDGFALQLYV